MDRHSMGLSCRRTPALILVLSFALSACSAAEEAERAEVTTPSGPSPATTADPTGPIATGTPAARCYAVMTDASGKTGVLLFGGFDNSGPPGAFLPDLWGFAPGDGWTQVSAAVEAEPGDLFAYDLDADRIVYVGASTVWSVDPAVGGWEEVGGPGPELHGARMVYDSASDRLIAFGGDDFSTLFDNTWAYDYETDTWTKMDPLKPPSARSFYAMAYDEGSDRVILFGGFDEFDDSLGDTWAYDYDRDRWTRLSRTGGPEPRGYSAMAYDRKGDRMILFGGVTGPQEEPLDDTWSYDLETNTWRKLQASGPSARGWHVMAADRETNSIVLFGGGASRSDCTGETWIFDPRANTWSHVA